MGIKNLFKLINENAPDSITEKKLKDYTNKVLVLDASLVIYQYVIAIRGTGNDLQNDEGEMTSHILGVINKSLMLLKHDILPVFVFDGKPPEQKGEVLKSRKKLKNKSIEKLKEDNYENEEDKIKDFKKSYTITREQTKQVKQMLELFGIPFVENCSEADPLCSHIVKTGMAYGVASEDMDILTFGSPILLRGLHSTKKMKEINLDKILKSLKFTQDEFIDLCILLGCDYCPTIPKIGTKRALDIIKKYRSIDIFIENEKSKYKIPDNFNYQEARNLFKNPCLLELNIKKFKLHKPEYNKIKEIMIDIYDFKLDKVNEYLNKIKLYYRKMSNTQKGGMSKYVVTKNI